MRTKHIQSYTKHITVVISLLKIKSNQCNIHTNEQYLFDTKKKILLGKLIVHKKGKSFIVEKKIGLVLVCWNPNRLRLDIFCFL